MIGVIAKTTAGGNYFLKLTGPERTVDAAAAPLRQTFGGDASAETEYKLSEN
jgi:gluconolactonase